MNYPCCIICGEKNYPNNHWFTKHPQVMTDAITMRAMGKTPDEIDDIILTQEYLDGNYPGFHHDGIEYDMTTVVAMRMFRDKDFMREVFPDYPE